MCSQILDNVFMIKVLKECNFLLQRLHFLALIIVVAAECVDRHLLNGDWQTIGAVEAEVNSAKRSTPNFLVQFKTRHSTKVL